MSKESAKYHVLWVLSLFVFGPATGSVAEGNAVVRPSEEEAAAALKDKTRKRIAGAGYTDEERAAILANLEKLQVLATYACYPALDAPLAQRICVMRSMGWQGKPFFQQTSMAQRVDGSWHVLDETLKAACPSASVAQDALRSILSENLQVAPPAEIDRFGLFVDPPDVEAPGAESRLRCHYDVRGLDGGRRARVLVRYDGRAYRFDPDIQVN